ncbi:hypothetical protein IKP85_06110 [bacterium]|nr:hypothetical protein [bacterium]
MRRGLFIILSFLIFALCPANQSFGAYNDDLPENLQVEDEPAPVLPNIFIWQIPDEDIEPAPVITEEDDYAETEAEEKIPTEEELYYANYDNIPLKGYLDFIEDSNAISLKKPDKDYALNISVPQKFESLGLSDKDKIPTTTFAHHVYSRSTDNIQYNIAPFDDVQEYTHKGFSVGTSYNESIDNSDLGFTTSLYTKYETKYFALKTSYDKNAGVSYSDVIDKFSFTPEIKLNRYVSIKDVITSDITRDRKKNEIILSIKPTADERVRFEFGAGHTFDANNELMRTQVKFSTYYKW